jgi:predicted HAD superfamily phosphohydrolase
MPPANYPELWNAYLSNAASIVGEENVGDLGHKSSSSDFGDVSQIMPGIQPFAGGISGTPHGNDYLVNDYDVAVINPAKAMAATVIDLQADNAEKAKEILTRNKPPMTKEQYLKFLNSIFNEEEYQG